MNENWTEKLIDVHLEEPNTAEPSLGFESRLLARVAEQRAARKRPVFWIVWASAAVAAVIIAIAFLNRPVAQKAQRMDTAKVVAPAQPSAVTPTAVTAESVVAKRPIAPKWRHEVTTAAVNARQEVFPAPSPLSEQERLAFAYLRATPRSEVIAMSRPEPEVPHEINQAVPGPELNRTLQNTLSGSTR